jgi:hypothetical protein
VVRASPQYRQQLADHLLHLLFVDLLRTLVQLAHHRVTQ